MTVEEAIKHGLEHHKVGRLKEAEQLYRQVLAVQPNNPDGQHLLGLIAHQVGRPDVAADLIGKAIAASPNIADFWSNRALVLTTLGRLDEAAMSCAKALELKPDMVDPRLNWSEVLRRQGKLQESLQKAQQGLALRPESPDGICCVANVLKDMGRVAEAVDWFRRAIAIRPQFPEALNNLGNALTQLERFPEAEAVYREALRYNPMLAEGYNNLGAALKGQRKIQEAIVAFRKAIELKPTLPEPYSELGDTLRAMRQMDEAIVMCKKAIEMRPNFGDAYHNLAFCLQECGNVKEAIIHYDKAIALRPTSPESHNNRANCFKDLGLMHEAIESFRRAIIAKPDFSQAHSNMVYSMHYPDGYTPEQISEEHMQWGRQHADPLRHLIKPHNNDRSPERRLRVGYVSPNFRDQVINFCLEPALKLHDKQNFEIFMYSDVQREDEITTRLKAIGHQWRNILTMTDQQAADLIRQDRIDILIDPCGHIAYNRLLLFARKPAPVQVSYLGYQNTTGMKTMDYIIADELTCPTGVNEHLYTEKVVRIPGCFWAYLPQPTPDVVPPPALKNGYVTFAFLNNFAKLTPRMMSVWCEVLKGVPNSKLMVLTREAASFSEYLQSMLRENGVEPARLIVEGLRPKWPYLQLFERVDIAFDPFPFNGHTTTHDCLWMGVPVVHLQGDTYASRYGGSVLKMAGLEKWITTLTQGYVKCAIELAGDLGALAELRKTLRQNILDSDLVNGPKFTKDLEAAYRGMWREYCGASGQ